MMDSFHKIGETSRRERLIMGVIVLLAVWVLFYLSTQRHQALRHAPTGFDGLQVWLMTSDLPTQVFAGGWTLEKSDIDLLVQPLFETRLDQARQAPKTEKEILFQEDETDQRVRILLEKAQAVPSLIVLPKWRSGLRLSGLARPDMLVETHALNRSLNRLLSVPPEVNRAQTSFETFAYTLENGSDVSARLYAAQVLKAPGCTPIIGVETAMLLGACPVFGSDSTVLILADPDLFNNHGLMLGDNAYIATDCFRGFVRDGQIVIDYATRNWLVDRRSEQPPARSWSDFQRFFEPPFFAMWIGAALSLVLLLWRSGLRYGPVIDETEDMSASKLQAIQAQARLLRLTGQDGALLAEYTRARLSSLVLRLLCPGQVQVGTDRDLILRHVRRKDPGLANDMQSLLETIDAKPPGLAARDAIAQVDALERVIEKVVHDA